MKKTTLVWLSVICVYAVLALLARTGLIATSATTPSAITYQEPSAAHWLGTDIFGRDIFSRAVHGASVALAVGVFSALIATALGLVLGAVAGFFGGWIDDVVVWFYTTWDSIPYILLLAAFAWILGPGLGNVFIALGLTSWVTTCRIVRSEVARHKNRDYVTAARALGLGPTRILVRHILPNLWHLVLIQFGLCFVAAIKIEVILSFLGLGVEPGTPSWGAMIDEGKQEIANGFWWNILAASGFLFGLVLAVNLLMESVRSTLDVRFTKRQTDS